MANDDLVELGTSGLRRSGGAITEEILPTLIGKRGARAYRDMAENDPVIGAILFAIEKVITRLDWHVAPGGDTPADVETADFVDECMNDMSESWQVTLSQILSMLIFGWSFHEIVYKRRQGPNQTDPTRRSKHGDNRIGWRKWAIRSQESLWLWEMDPTGGVQGMIQNDPYNAHATGGGTIVIPIDKALLFRTSVQKGNPEGRSLLRNAYRPWFYKKRIEEIEAVGIERDLAGLPVAYVPPEYLSSTSTPEQQQVLAAIQQIVTSIKRNEQEGIVFPTVYDDGGHKMFDLALLSSGGSRQFDTDKVITRYDQRISMSVLSDFLLLGHDRVGSYSLGNTKMDLWSLAIDSIAKSIAEVVNTHAIPRLLTLNGISVDTPPRITYGDVAHVDLAAVADFVQRLTQAGAIVPDTPLEEYLREVAGLPVAEPDRGVEPGMNTIPTHQR